MKTKAIKAGFAVSALALAISPAMAAEIRFDGFASFVAGQVIDKDELAGDSLRGFDERLSFQENSLFAVQVRADLQEKLSATAQIIAKGSEDYDARFNWAYLSYELSNEISIKVGRFRTPLFMYSDFLDVGYAYHWISPPDSVYDLGGFDSADGIMVEYQTHLGDWTSTFTVNATRSNSDLEGGNLENTNSHAVVWSMNRDWLTLRAVYSAADVTLRSEDVNALAAGLSQAGVSQSVLDNMLMDNDRGTFGGVGVSLDFGTYFAMAEYTEITADNSFAPDKRENWYVSGGTRIGKYTVYATIESSEGEINERARDDITNTLAPAIEGLTAMNPVPGTQEYAQLVGLQQLSGGAAAAFNVNRTEYELYSIGMRYDFHPSAAFKVEYLHMDDKLNNVDPAVIAVAIDLVY